MKTQVTVPSAQQHCTITNVALFGSADVDDKHPLYQEAFKVARYLAYHGKVVVNGGGPGVMAAATLGAQSVGGDTLAVTFYPKDMPNFEGRFAGNQVKKEIKTANYIERMFGLMDHADAFICFQGGTGTLSEWATAWLLAHLYHGNHKPLILYGEFWHDVMRVINDHFLIGEQELEVYKIVNNEEELVEALAFFEKELETRCGLLPKPSSKTEPAKVPVPTSDSLPVANPLTTMSDSQNRTLMRDMKHSIRDSFRNHGSFKFKSSVA
jgi:uncharacterized protein (TIGR00725 family)